MPWADAFLLARERDDALAAGAWGEVARPARLLRQPEFAAEACGCGQELVEGAPTGTARKRALLPLRSPGRKALS